MRPVRIFPLVCLLPLLLAHTLAQDAPRPKSAGKTELLKLYRTAGTVWHHRVVSWQRGGAAESSTESGRVESVEGNNAVVVESTRTFTGLVNGTKTARDLSKPTDEDLAFADEKLPLEELDLGFARFACRRHRVTRDGEQITTWVSTEHHPLVIKQVRLGPDHSVIRKLTGFALATPDPWLLYRMAGRRWVHKNSTGKDAATTHYMVQTVKSVASDHAMVSMDMLDKDRKSMLGGVEIPPTRYNFTAIAEDGVLAENPPVPTREKLTTEAGEFDCMVTKTGETKVWMSAVWTMLVVKLESPTMVQELVEFDLGHDLLRFFRTAGNTETTRITTEVGGMQATSLTRRTVTKFEDGKATVQTVTLDGNGREVTRNEMQLDVPDKTLPVLKYAGQREELVVTPAGNFVAIVQSPGNELRNWTHHGITVKQEMRNADFVMTTEVTDLKLD
ncbi:MAG: hypothetical protein HS108_14010 [Planctomycetes bacterium]|jgi:hypothetical protein|nr:hypothetical protein [Planctomycetota bacterium]MCL4731128.1 hypothetical protein [Planctomycetota bacterium]